MRACTSSDPWLRLQCHAGVALRRLHSRERVCRAFGALCGPCRPCAPRQAGLLSWLAPVLPIQPNHLSSPIPSPHAPRSAAALPVAQSRQSARPRGRAAASPPAPAPPQPPAGPCRSGMGAGACRGQGQLARQPQCALPGIPAADDAMPAAEVRGRAQRPCAWEQPPPDCSLLTVSAPPQRPWRPGRSGSAAAARSGPAAGMSRPAGGSCHAARKRWRAAPCCRVFAGCQRNLRPGSATPHRPRRTCTGASAGGRRSPASSPCAKATPASSEACRRGDGARGKALQLGVGGEPRCQADALVRGMAAPSWQRRLLAGAWLVRARPPHLTRSPLPIWEKRTGSSSSLPPGEGPYQSPLPPPPLLELSSCPGAGPSRRRE